MIERTLGPHLLELATWYPVISLTGPRQSGKSTLVRHVFSDYDYVNLEDPATRSRALADPTGFVEDLRERTIIDEAQYAPELFSAIQARSDAHAASGQFVLTGSQNFLLLGHISQSLAGRVGIAKLLPLSYPEIVSANETSGKASLAELMVRGSYPALHAGRVPTHVFYQNYLDTYLTRDVAGYLDVRRISVFRAFLEACAARVGSLLNCADLARDCGASVPTVKGWLSILETSYIVRLLRPKSANLSKRLAKRPKLYFIDTGLLCHLLGVRSEEWFTSSEWYGPVFENYVISEQLKRACNRLEEPRLSYYRDDSKREIDLIEETPGEEARAVEIKSGRTYRPSFASTTRAIASELGLAPAVIYGGDGTFDDHGVQVFGVREWLTRES